MTDGQDGASTASVHAPGSDTPNQGAGTVAAPSSNTSGQRDAIAPVGATGVAPAPQGSTTQQAGAQPQSAPIDTSSSTPPRFNAGVTGSADPNDYGKDAEGNANPAPENPSPLSTAYKG